MSNDIKKLQNILKYLPLLETDNFGTWIIDRKNDGTPDHPVQVPFVGYSEIVCQFIADVYDFNDNNEEFELGRYGEILERNGIEWNSKSMSEADVSSLDEQCIMALIMGAVRAERFCDGALLKFFKDGSIKKWVERLTEINMHCCADYNGKEIDDE